MYTHKQAINIKKHTFLFLQFQFTKKKKYPSNQLYSRAQQNTFKQSNKVNQHIFSLFIVVVVIDWRV